MATPHREKGRKMTGDGSIQETWIQELVEVHSRMALLAEGTVDADTVPGELKAIEGRLARLISDLKGDDGVPEGGPESKTVLVVDDNDELRDFVCQALMLAGYQVLDTPDAESTLTLFQGAASVDLVLCDVILPEAKGPDLMAQIRALRPDVKVVFMSGYVAKDIVNLDVEQILSSGGVFLQKPFTTRHLLETVHDSLGV